MKSDTTLTMQNCKRNQHGKVKKKLLVLSYLRWYITIWKIDSLWTACVKIFFIFVPPNLHYSYVILKTRK